MIHVWIFVEASMMNMIVSQRSDGWHVISHRIMQRQTSRAFHQRLPMGQMFQSEQERAFDKAKSMILYQGNPLFVLALKTNKR